VKRRKKSKKKHQQRTIYTRYQPQGLEIRMNHAISYNALTRITTRKTLNIEGYIKKKKVTVLIDLGSTCDFIHCKVAKDLNFFLYPAPKCQVMVENSGTVNFSGKCQNINTTMGEYALNSPMLSIPMGSVDV